MAALQGSFERARRFQFSLPLHGPYFLGRSPRRAEHGTKGGSVEPCAGANLGANLGDSSPGLKNGSTLGSLRIGSRGAAAAATPGDGKATIAPSQGLECAQRSAGSRSSARPGRRRETSFGPSLPDIDIPRRLPTPENRGCSLSLLHLEAFFSIPHSPQYNGAPFFFFSARYSFVRKTTPLPRTHG